MSSACGCLPIRFVEHVNRSRLERIMFLRWRAKLGRLGDRWTQISNIKIQRKMEHRSTMSVRSLRNTWCRNLLNNPPMLIAVESIFTRYEDHADCESLSS